MSFDLVRTAEISTTPRLGNFIKMIRYGPTLLRSLPFHFGSLQRLHVAPLGVIFLFKFVDRLLQAFPRVAWESGKLLLGMVGNLNAIANS